MTPAPRPARSVFSLWAWLMLAPYMLTAFGGFDGVQTVPGLVAGIATAAVVHLALGVAFLLLGMIDRRLAPQPPLRWAFVGLALGALAVGRPALMYQLHAALHLELVTTPFWVRVTMNVVVLGIAILLLHAVIEAASRNLEARRRLLVLLASLRIQAERIEQEQQRIAASFRREVADPVIDALGRLVSRDLPPEQLAAELSWVAELVVRPISHRTQAADLDEALDDIDPALPVPRPGRALLQPSRVIAAPAWAVTVITTLLLLPVELNLNGVGLGLLLLVAGAAASFLGGHVIERLPLPRRGGPSIAILSIAYLLLAGITCWVLIGPGIALAQAPYYLSYSSLAFATVGVILAILRSARRELVANQQRIATAIGHAERRVFRAREELAATGERMGRLLHTGVQGDIVGTALRLRAGTAAPEALERLLERVVVALQLDPDPDVEAPAAAIRDALLATLSTWSRSLDLELDVPEEALDRLAAHPSAASLANDAITEGLTNAVRHGRTDLARVAMSPLAEGVEIRITNPGRLGPRAGGLGLSDLDARARQVELRQDGEDVLLRVLV